MIDLQALVKEWGGPIGIFGAIVAVWAKFGIRRIDLKTDGYLSWRSRAEIAEAKLEEKDFNRNRADLKEEKNYARKQEEHKKGDHGN